MHFQPDKLSYQVSKYYLLTAVSTFKIQEKVFPILVCNFAGRHAEKGSYISEIRLAARTSKSTFQ